MIEKDQHVDTWRERSAQVKDAVMNVGVRAYNVGWSFVLFLEAVIHLGALTILPTFILLVKSLNKKYRSNTHTVEISSEEPDLNSTSEENTELAVNSCKTLSAFPTIINDIPIPSSNLETEILPQADSNNSTVFTDETTPPHTPVNDYEEVESLSKTVTDSLSGSDCPASITDRKSCSPALINETIVKDETTIPHTPVNENIETDYLIKTVPDSPTGDNVPIDPTCNENSANPIAVDENTKPHTPTDENVETECLSKTVPDSPTGDNDPGKTTVPESSTNPTVIVIDETTAPHSPTKENVETESLSKTVPDSPTGDNRFININGNERSVSPTVIEEATVINGPTAPHITTDQNIKIESLNETVCDNPTFDHGTTNLTGDEDIASPTVSLIDEVIVVDETTAPYTPTDENVDTECLSKTVPDSPTADNNPADTTSNDISDNPTVIGDTLVETTALDTQTDETVETESYNTVPDIPTMNKCPTETADVENPTIQTVEIVTAEINGTTIHQTPSDENVGTESVRKTDSEIPIDSNGSAETTTINVSPKDEATVINEVAKSYSPIKADLDVRDIPSSSSSNKSCDSPVSSKGSKGGKNPFISFLNWKK